MKIFVALNSEGLVVAAVVTESREVATRGFLRDGIHENIGAVTGPVTLCAPLSPTQVVEFSLSLIRPVNLYFDKVAGTGVALHLEDLDTRFVQGIIYRQPEGNILYTASRLIGNFK